MNPTVAYSLLKYTHSKLIGEELNVGILFVFPEIKRVEFLFPQSISRIKKTYPNASVELIKSYLASFRKKAPKLNKHIEKYIFGFDELISEQFLVPDGSSLQFSKFSHALQIGDIENTKKIYYDLYLGHYDSPHHNEPHRKNDKVIVNQCKKLIIHKRPEVEKALHIDKQPIKIGKISFKFDLRWQNGTSNLIKGVSFDFKDEDDITDRALLIQNQLNYLEKEIIKSNARVDLLLSKPQNLKFIDAYEYAKSILKDSIANKEIIEEEGIESYADKVVKEIEL